MKIYDEASISASSTARRVLEGEFTLKQGINYLVEQHGLGKRAKVCGTGELVSV